MRVNKWTLGLAACGLVSLPALIQAEEKMSSVQTALSSTTISGYVNTSAHWDLGTGNDNVPGYAYNNNKQDGFNLDVISLTIERPLDEGQWSAGYKANVLFGPDANFLATQSGGTLGGDFAIKQGYVALRAPIGTGLDVKLGVFDTVVGYETFDAGNNPNYTRSYGYTIEPTTHTGVLVTYQFGEMFGVSAGVANTFGPTINEKAWSAGGTNVADRAESYKTYMASIAFSAPKDWGFIGGSTLYAGIINGLNSGYNTGHETHYYVGGALATPLAGLKLGASYDYARAGHVENNLIRSNDDHYAWAAALYASFQPQDSKLGFHLRGEYASRSGDTLSSSSPFTFMPEKVFALTGTVQYDLWKNVLSRLEIRWDHAGGDWKETPYGPDALSGALNGSGTKRNAYLVAANLIYKF
jgi:hypothetical protein